MFIIMGFCNVFNAGSTSEVGVLDDGMEEIGHQQGPSQARSPHAPLQEQPSERKVQDSPNGIEAKADPHLGPAGNREANHVANAGKDG